ncbi:hypothetical protein FJZ53_04800 [Candidatus Woesearchaeota archaeon]|nr:hypothetical protein [Candidatus Woesearchaeota archaeon]
MVRSFNREEFDTFLIDEGVVELREDKVKLSSGRKSNLYINIRKLTDDVTRFDKLKDYAKDFINDKNLKPDYFLGVPEGMTKLGLIMTYTQAQKDLMFSYESYVSEGLSKDYPLPMARSKAKQHGSGKGQKFLGSVKGKAVVLEDVLTTGDSVISLVEDLASKETEILAVIGVVDRLELREDGLSVKEKLQELGVKYYAMTSVKTLLPLAYEILKPSKKVAKKINSYYKKYGCEYFKIII